MPCFAYKRAPSPALGAQPPHKRMKIIHPSTPGLAPSLSDVSSGNCSMTAPAAEGLLSGVDQSHSVRPLTQCRAANEVCELRELDALAPARMPQTLLSWTASHQLLCNQPQRVPKSAVVSGSPCAHATPEDARYISSPRDAWAESPTARRSLPLHSSAAAPATMAFNFASAAGPSTSRSYQFPFVNNGSSSLPAAGMSCEADVLHYLYEDLDQGSYDFSEDGLAQFEFPVCEELSELQRCGADMSPPNPQSPIVRSLSRSSYGSSAYLASSSPVDYPTPASDSSVTTPALSEAFGWLPDFPTSLFGHQAPAFAPEAKARGELECAYVQPFPGSAPLSPNAFSTYAFDACQPEPPAAFPSNEATSGLAGARRHSEPANLAALQFPLFLQEQLAQIAPPPPDAPATRPITDNLACPPSAAGPSSIAPHQTQLPRRLEIVQPKPVRAYKPPILRGDCHYDPKDFVRRHSEPILPLRELDVCSHLPTDVEEEEEDETMTVDGGEDEFYDGDVSSDGMGDETLMDDFSFEGLDEQAFSGDAQQDFMFDPEWSWFQPSATTSTATASAPQPDWPGADMFGGPIDWTTAFAVPATSTGHPSNTRLDGFQHL